MSGHDEEFEQFLKRERPLFRRDVDDGLEPPAELDRIVLRQARQAIEDERPVRMFGMPRWAAPMAIAASLVLGISIVFKAGMPPITRIPEVSVENIAQRVEYPAAAEESRAAAAAPAETNVDASGDAPVVVELSRPLAGNSAPALAESRLDRAPRAEAESHAAPPPPAPPALVRGETNQTPQADARRADDHPQAAKASESVADAVPSWRRDVQAWQSEIARLRASGDTESADAEQAEFNRQHRAYAVSPDR